MKRLLCLLLALVPVLSFAYSSYGGGSSAGVPTIPCYVSGEYVGTMEINQCQAMQKEKS